MYASGLDSGSGGNDSDDLLSMFCNPEPVDIVVEYPVGPLLIDDPIIGDDTIEELSFDIAVAVIDVIDENTFKIEISWDPDGDGQYERLDCGCDSSLL